MVMGRVRSRLSNDINQAGARSLKNFYLIFLPEPQTDKPKVLSDSKSRHAHDTQSFAVQVE